MDFDETTTSVDLVQLDSDGKQKAKPRTANLLVLTGSQAGRLYRIEHKIEVIGRSGGASVRIEDDGVSRRHAQVLCHEDGSFLLVDLGSTNGTFCNGNRVKQSQLEDGDKIQIGTTTVLKFTFHDAVEEDFQRRQYESATRDGLTGCYNKKYLLERLPAELAFATRHDKLLAVVLFDLDHFKAVNDTYGHQAGDLILKQLASIVREEVRASDVLARYGGEEFVLLLRETTLQAAQQAAERIRTRVEATRFDHDDRHIHVTVSFGITVAHPGDDGKADRLLREADQHLYRAKDTGRNRVEPPLTE